MSATDAIKQIKIKDNDVRDIAATYDGSGNEIAGTYVTLNTNQTIAGIKTFNAPTNISGTEQATATFNTANGGRIIFGKEAGNSGTMIGLDQVSGTRRLNFRASATAGAIVWSQPESNSSLYYDVTNVWYRTTNNIYFNQIKSAPFLGTDSSGKVQKVTPKTLTFTGASTGTYNGTEAITVDITDIIDLTEGL